ncbi:hypothetical protein EK21DRAFT_115891 [Setomelanomma holmii]|uniref:Uncharacterized protein n=1 Tax=Setomelanomma holmii TaxID=210430 RepID=A0A9P4LJ85_9PLEO|nr:hypothetical protein EK21DRAFT_115891 [Setomelanomma holmii]
MAGHRNWRRGCYGYRSTAPSEAGDSETATTTTTETTTSSATSQTTIASIPVQSIPERSVSSKAPESASVARVTEGPPRSKTSIAHVSYHLKELPRLFVIEVEMMAFKQPEVALQAKSTEPKGEWKPLWSRRLRNEAMIELLEPSQYDKIHDFVVVNSCAGHNSNHIIVPLDNLDKATIKELLASSSQVLPKTKRRVKSGDGFLEQPILCEIMEGRICSESRLAKLYWQSFLLMIRKRATRGMSGSKYGIDHYFKDTLQHANMTGIDVSVKKEGRSWPLVLRNTQTIDTGRKPLQLNYDLDVVIPLKKRVRSLLIDVLGSKTVDEIDGTSAAHMSVVERLLIGLQVRCAFLPPDKDAMQRTQRGEVFLEKLDRRCRQFRVADVRMPSAIPNFKIEGLQGEFSVPSYFNDVIHPVDKKLAKQPKSTDPLLLVSDGKDHWVPIDMIYIDDSSATSRFSYLHAVMKSKIATFIKQAEVAEEKIKPKGADFFSKIAKMEGEARSHDSLHHSYTDEMQTNPLLTADKVDFLSVDPLTLAIL